MVECEVCGFHYWYAYDKSALAMVCADCERKIEQNYEEEIEFIRAAAKLTYPAE